MEDMDLDVGMQVLLDDQGGRAVPAVMTGVLEKVNQFRYKSPSGRTDFDIKILGIKE